MSSSEASRKHADYPYGSGRLVPDWGSAKARRLVLVSLLAAVAATWLAGPVALGTIDDVALRLWLPALLAIVLALAPEPRVRLGRIAKDMTVVSLLVAIAAGDLVPLMVACFPLVLAAAALASRSPLLADWWRETP